MIVNDFNDKFLVIPSLSIHPNELYLYGKKESLTDYPITNRKSIKNLENNSNKNRLSSTAERKVKRAINYLLYQASPKKATNNKIGQQFKFKIAFVTLTLSSHQNHSDQQIKDELLGQLLTELKQKYKVSNYVWKAERQLNGNLHFHILVDKFIPYNELRNIWNRIQNKLGYVDQFQKYNNHNNPNSTDIHSVSEKRNISSYLCKYMTKHTYQNRRKEHRNETHLPKRHLHSKESVSDGAKEYLTKEANNGRIWGCSYSLSDLKGGQTEIDDNILIELTKLQKVINAKRIDKEYVSMIFFDSNKLSQSEFPILYEIFHSYIVSKFGFYQPQIIYNDIPPNVAF